MSRVCHGLLATPRVKVQGLGSEVILALSSFIDAMWEGIVEGRRGQLGLGSSGSGLRLIHGCAEKQSFASFYCLDPLNPRLPGPRTLNPTPYPKPQP